MPMRFLSDPLLWASRRQVVSGAMVLIVTSVLGGCGSAVPRPRAARLKRDSCQYCGMPVSDPRFVAEIWDSDYHRVRIYDDFGCAVMAAAGRGEIERSDVAFWVADESEPSRFLDARSAHYRSGAPTPMGHGFAAGPEKGHSIDFAAATSAIREKALCAHSA